MPKKIQIGKLVKDPEFWVLGTAIVTVSFVFTVAVASVIKLSKEHPQTMDDQCLVVKTEDTSRVFKCDSVGDRNRFIENYKNVEQTLQRLGISQPKEVEFTKTLCSKHKEITVINCK